MQITRSIFLNSLRILSCALVATLFGIASTNAATVTVGQFGDQGWRSDDTRDISGNDLVGTYSTNAGDPAVAPTLAGDAAIAQQIKFVSTPTGSTYGGAISMDGTATGSGKSNISVIDVVNGFAPASDLVSPTFSVQYEMYKQHTGGGSTLAFKLGIQSADWGTGVGQSQEGPFVATRSGESAWDLVLVHVPTIAVVDNNTWQTINLDQNSGTWSLFRQAGNLFFPAPSAAKTLDDWFADATWGPKLFGAGAKVSSVQFGLGSGQSVAIGYVDYLQTSLLNGGDVINFIPEPSTYLLAGFGAVGLLALRKRRAAK